MPQSYSRIFIHLVFSTRHRAPIISPALRAELHPCLAGALREMDCPPVQVGGVQDHVHLLFGLSRTRSVAKVAEAIKANSSKWSKRAGVPHFAWQTGYGAFSVSQSSASVVVRYIREQERHHRRRSFQDELRALLRRHGIAYDERYLWD